MPVGFAQQKLEFLASRATQKLSCSCEWVVVDMSRERQPALQPRSGSPLSAVSPLAACFGPKQGALRLNDWGGASRTLQALGPRITHLANRILGLVAPVRLEQEMWLDVAPSRSASVAWMLRPSSPLAPSTCIDLFHCQIRAHFLAHHALILP
jgi:hypothetical protein